MIPRTDDVPLAPGARDPKPVGATLVGGGLTGREHTVDAPPGEVAAFYAAHFGRPGERDADGATRWLFAETTTRASEVVDERLVVSVRPEGPGTRLLIALTVSVRRPAPRGLLAGLRAWLSRK